MRFNPEILLVFPVFVLSIVVHECAHGLVALWNGDTTARDRGRLTLNPLPHVDPIGSLLLPGFGISGFWTAVGGSLVVSLVSWVGSWFIGPRGRVEIIRGRRD